MHDSRLRSAERIFRGRRDGAVDLRLRGQSVPATSSRCGTRVGQPPASALYSATAPVALRVRPSAKRVLRLQPGAFGVEHVEQVGGAGLVADARQFRGARRCRCAAARDARPRRGRGRSAPARSRCPPARAARSARSARARRRRRHRPRRCAHARGRRRGTTSRRRARPAASRCRARTARCCRSPGVPISPPSVKRGNRSAVATPMRAVAACSRCSAAATSGRRRSRSPGVPASSRAGSAGRRLLRVQSRDQRARRPGRSAPRAGASSRRPRLRAPGCATSVVSSCARARDVSNSVPRPASSRASTMRSVSRWLSALLRATRRRSCRPRSSR